ncbi:hypothetical protein AGR1C_pAt40014 [Agrobacterium fabacearum TT111]|nr:hypothetical protein AGR1C_pAt40014 [Agrobacterium fabacearum TT111]
MFGHAYSFSLGTSAEGEREYEASFNKGCIGLSLLMAPKHRISRLCCPDQSSGVQCRLVN